MVPNYLYLPLVLYTTTKTSVKSLFFICLDFQCSVYFIQYIAGFLL